MTDEMVNEVMRWSPSAATGLQMWAESCALRLASFGVACLAVQSRIGPESWDSVRRLHAVLLGQGADGGWMQAVHDKRLALAQRHWRADPRRLISHDVVFGPCCGAP